MKHGKINSCANLFENSIITKLTMRYNIIDFVVFARRDLGCGRDFLL